MARSQRLNASGAEDGVTAEINPVPMNRDELMTLLGLEQPRNAAKISMVQGSKLSNIPAKGKKRRRKTTSSSTDSDEYSDDSPEDDYDWCYGASAILRRTATTKQKQALQVLDLVLDEIVKAKPRVFDDNTEGRRFAEALKQIRSHQSTLTAADTRAFLDHVYNKYRAVHGQALRAYRNLGKPEYYHPADDRHNSKCQNVKDQLRTFTEENVNGWTMADNEDPSIVYRYGETLSGGGRHADALVAYRNEDAASFPLGMPRANQPGLTQALHAFKTMQLRSDIRERTDYDRNVYGTRQYKMLGSQLVDSSGIISIKGVTGKIWAIRNYRVGDDPVKAVKATFENDGVEPQGSSDFPVVLLGLKMKVAEGFNDRHSNLSKHRAWFWEIKSRELRCEISELLRQRWRFVLQHLPPQDDSISPKEESEYRKQTTTHCAVPFCKYHKGKMLPPDSYRLEFLDIQKEEERAQRYWLDEEKEISPGRGANGRMWFCVTCIEHLFNGVWVIRDPMVLTQALHDSPSFANDTSAPVGENRSSLVAESPKFDTLWKAPKGEIEAEWQRRMVESAENAFASTIVCTPRKEKSKATPKSKPSIRFKARTGTAAELPSPTSKQAEQRCPAPPEYGPILKPPGLSPFANQLSSFIDSELRHTCSEFYTLNSFEYHALHAWKELCARKQMFGVPQNIAFCNQIEDDYYLNLTMSGIRVSNDPGHGKEEWMPLSIHQGHHIPVMKLNMDDISTVKRVPEGGPPIRIVKPLSSIMALINGRVKDAMIRYGVTYDGDGVKPRPIAERTWPPVSYWEEAFQKERERIQAEMPDTSAVDAKDQEQAEASSSDINPSSSSEEEGPPPRQKQLHGGLPTNRQTRN